MRIAILAATATLSLAPGVSAHHGWGSYDANTVVKLEAPILEMKYENPHGELLLEQAGQRWTVTLAPPFRMQNRALERGLLVVGKQISVEGYPSRVNPNEMRAERVVVDGKVFEMR